MKPKTLPSRRRAAFRCLDPGHSSSSFQSDTGVTLIEVLIATVILVVGLLFVTDKDLKMAGGKDQVGAEAQILVREQLSLLGNTSLRGQIVIENTASTSDLVTDNRVGGNAMLTNNGTLVGTGFAATGWREL